MSEDRKFEIELWALKDVTFPSVPMPKIRRAAVNKLGIALVSIERLARSMKPFEYGKTDPATSTAVSIAWPPRLQTPLH